MLCQKCGLSDATVHRKLTIFRQPVEEHLCEMCAGVGSALTGLPNPRSFRGGNWKGKYTVSTTYKVVMVDKDGNAMGPPEEMPVPPAPEAIPNGLSAIPACLARLFASKNNVPNSCLIVSTSDGGIITIIRTGTEVELNVMLIHQSPEGLEATLREFFSKRGIGVKRDFGKVTLYQARHIFFALPDSCEQTSQILTNLLRSCFSVREDDTINVRFIRA